MGTVKYTGPVASFHCPTNAEIRSLKVHFSPKQLGSGDPSPENVREIVGWDGVEAYDYASTNVSISSIPTEYKKVEYLESTGTQYIYTNVPGRYGIECRAKVSWTSDGDTTIFGARKTASDRIMLIHQYPSNRWTLGYGASYTGLSLINFNTIYDVESKVYPGEQYLKINGTTVYTGTDSAEYSNDFNMSLFACTNSSSNNFNLKASARIYSLSAKLDGVEVLNIVPCLRKSDNKPGMYDTVSQIFYTNAGTGEFLYGPEISGYTTDYEFGTLGKNKLSDNSDDYMHNYGSPSAQIVPTDFVFSGGEFSGTVPSNTRDFCVHLDQVKHAPGTYTLSYDYINNGLNYQWAPVICSYSNENNWYSSLSNNASSKASENSGHVEKTFTATKPFYVNLSLNNNGNTSQEAQNKICNLQLELGSTATTYEPYDPKHTVYGGWVDLISGEAVRDWILNEHTVAATDGTPGGAGTGGDTNYRFVAWNLASAHLPDSERTNIAICDIMPMNKTVGGTRFWIGGGTVYAILPNDNKEYSLTIAYAERDLNTDKYSLSPTQLQTFLGHNNVWSNADYVEVEYDLHETQNILARKNFIIANQPHIETASGNIVSFKTDVSAPLMECKIHFSPVQEGSGDPSTSNIRDISGWDSVNIFRAGKNILPQTQDENGMHPLFVKQGTFVTASSMLPNNDSNDQIRYYDKNKTQIDYWNLIFSSGSHHFRSFKTLADAEWFHFLYNGDEQQVEFGSKCTSYEPYNGTTVPISWSSSAGTIYGGYVDLLSGKLVQTWDYLVIDGVNRKFNAALNLRPSSTNTWDATGCGIQVSYFTNFLCNIKNTMFTDDGNQLNDTNTIYNFAFSGRYYLVLLIGTYTEYGYLTAEEKKAFGNDLAQQHPIQIAYELNTPIEYQLTPTQLKTLRGQNNIWSNANGQVELSYWTH